MLSKKNTIVLVAALCSFAAASARDFKTVYTNADASRIAFPLGGMGAGMYCIEGTGYFSNMSVRNRPEVFHEPTMFAALHVKGIENGTKVLEGPIPEWRKTGQRGGFWVDPSSLGSVRTNYGFPHYSHSSFSSRFPFAEVKLTDDDIPVAVTIGAWSPFIPTNADDSSLPGAVLEYTLENRSGKNLEAVFSFNARHFLHVWNRGEQSCKPISNGFILGQSGTENEPHLQSEFAIFTDQPNTVVNHCWFRGGWFDGMTMAWNTVKSGELLAVPPVDKGVPGASLYVPVALKAGEKKTIQIYTVWYTPKTNLRFGGEPEDPKDNCAERTYTGEEYSTHRPWYSSKFANIQEVAAYFTSNADRMKKESELFSEAFYSSTLPAAVTEAVAGNLSILKSPTVLRQYDGRMWNWEGSGDDWGSCHGSCTHVWNYAQAIPHLFPAMERTLRETEFGESQNKAGHQTFRASLPIRPVDHHFYAAADGQMGGIMKIYRDWRIYGDKDWLKKMYPKIKASIDYCIATWDPYGKGTIEEPHHNTYDIEFWGSDGMHNSFYAGALSAIIRMGKYLGENVSKYEKLYKLCREFTDRELFDGEYYIQKIQWSGLKADDPVAMLKNSIGGGAYYEEAKVLLEKEGPKYQYGTGCLSDGVFGSSLARQCGLPEPLDEAKTKSHLVSVHKYNLRQTLVNHDNPQRPSFAFGDDGGLLLCSWPKGGALSLPFVYSNEVWTGIEYQVASHLMYNGEVQKGLEIVEICRERYDGVKRNPFNEIECGNWYARALSSYGMIQALTGMWYDAVDMTLSVDSQVGDFTAFLSTDTGFGTVTLKDGKVSLDVVYGQIPVKKYQNLTKTSR